MREEKKRTNIAYRCPSCFDTTFGIIGEFAYAYGMLRLKCDCGKSNLDILPKSDGKISLSVPCLFCKQNHTFTVSKSLIFERELFSLACPYSNMDICFVGKEDEIKGALIKSADSISSLVNSLELESARDLQPEDMSDAEILPDASVYDLCRLVVKELEADGLVDCPCHNGPYELRYTDTGIQVYCEQCGASYDFDTSTSATVHSYLDLDSIKLS
ncbi:MAG: hypothetical protein IJF38_07710 [Clostridia bacterium]|nr:hypothetical protein [Clostridia bacterium]